MIETAVCFGELCPTLVCIALQPTARCTRLQATSLNASNAFIAQFGPGKGPVTAPNGRKKLDPSVFLLSSEACFVGLRVLRGCFRDGVAGWAAE